MHYIIHLERTATLTEIFSVFRQRFYPVIVLPANTLRDEVNSLGGYNRIRNQDDAVSQVFSTMALSPSNVGKFLRRSELTKFRTCNWMTIYKTSQQLFAETFEAKIARDFTLVSEEALNLERKKPMAFYKPKPDIAVEKFNEF